MKLQFDQLNRHLKRTLEPIYIISGDEPFQVARSGDLIRQRAVKSGFSERHVYHIDKNFDWGIFISTANSLSLFSHKQIIELRMPNGKPGESGTHALLEYINNLSHDNLLLIITNRLENNTKRSKWFRSLESISVFIPVWPIEAHQLPQWINTQLQAEGYQATQNAVTLISERVQGNLIAATQELEKLKLLSIDKIIDHEQVLDAVSDSARYDVFQLIDTALDGNIKQCIRIISIIKDEGIEPTIVLWALAREIRLLSHCSRQLSKGISIDIAIENSAKTLGLPSLILKRKKSKLLKAIQRNSEQSFRNMIRVLSEIDHCIKGLNGHNPWNSLTALTLTLAGLTPIPELPTSYISNS